MGIRSRVWLISSAASVLGLIPIACSGDSSEPGTPRDAGIEEQKADAPQKDAAQKDAAEGGSESDSAQDSTVCTPIGVTKSADGYLDVRATELFPAPSSILPPGVVFDDTIPDTLDLADRAGR